MSARKALRQRLEEAEQQLTEAQRKNLELLDATRVLVGEKVRLLAELEAIRKQHPDRLESARMVADAVARMFGFDPAGIKRVEGKASVISPLYGPDGKLHEDRN